MATDVLMPQMGESIAEGTITRWLVKEGEGGERDQPRLDRLLRKQCPRRKLPPRDDGPASR